MVDKYYRAEAHNSTQILYPLRGIEERWVLRIQIPEIRLIA